LKTIKHPVQAVLSALWLLVTTGTTSIWGNGRCKVIRKK